MIMDAIIVGALGNGRDIADGKQALDGVSLDEGTVLKTSSVKSIDRVDERDLT